MDKVYAISSGHERVRKTFSDKKAELLANPHMLKKSANGSWTEPKKVS